MTLLSLVHVENILFDATCGLLISPRNEGIRYSGREPEGEERKEPNSDDEELHGVAWCSSWCSFCPRLCSAWLLTELWIIFFSQMHVVLESIHQVVILSPRAGVFQPSGKVAWSKADQTSPTRDQRYSSDDLKIIAKQRIEIHLDTYLKLLPEEIQRVLKAIPPPSPQFCWSECIGQRKAQAVRVSTSFQHPNTMFPSVFVYRLGLITSVKRTNWREVQTMLDLWVIFNECVLLHPFRFKSFIQTQIIINFSRKITSYSLITVKFDTMKWLVKLSTTRRKVWFTSSTVILLLSLQLWLEFIHSSLCL